jgi:hypothetical protein
MSTHREIVFSIDSIEVELTPLGFHVTRDGEPVPDKVHPPALLTFTSKSYARAFACAIAAEDSALAHELIGKHGRWWV